MIYIFLADDDEDDKEFFGDALKDLGIPSELLTAKDGAELMTTLDAIVIGPPPPHIIFLDLNMPNKNGFECLEEIRKTDKLKGIPVAIFSTTDSQSAVDTTYSLGANCYICKPTSHQLLKKAIETVLALELWKDNKQLPREKFVLRIN